MILPTISPRFVSTVGLPYLDESLLGYLTRAISISTIDQLPALSRIAKATKRYTSSLATELKDEGEIARLANLVGCAPNDIASRTYRAGQSEHDRTRLELVDFFGTMIRSRLRETKVRRVSPRALQQAQYHRAVWELRPFSFDPQTKELLLEACPVCGQRLGWIRAHGPTVCDKCVDEDGIPTVDLRDFTQPIIEVNDEEALDFVTGLVDPSPARKEAARSRLPKEFSEFPNADIFETVMSLGYGLAGYRPDRRMFSVEHMYQMTPELLCVAARAILDGQAGFDILCDRYRLAIEKKGTPYAQVNDLGRLAKVSYSESTIPPEIRFIFREMIEKNISSIRSRFDSAADFDELPLLDGELFRRFCPSLPKKHPIQVVVRDIVPIVPGMDDVLCPQHAAAMIGVPVYALQNLAERNLIERAEHAVAALLRIPTAYSRGSIEKLMERVEFRARQRSSGEKVPLACTRICTGMTPWTAVVLAVIEGGAPVTLDPNADKITLRNLRVTDPHAFVAGVRRHLLIEKATEDEWIGPEDAAEALKISQTTLCRLVAARPDLIGRRKGTTPYLFADVQATSAKYIFVGEIAFRRQLHPRLAVAWLSSVGTRPLFFLDNKHSGLVYLRDDVEPLLEPWTREAA
jgi:hypothetical protein